MSTFRDFKQERWIRLEEVDFRQVATLRDGVVHDENDEGQAYFLFLVSVGTMDHTLPISKVEIIYDGESSWSKVTRRGLHLELSASYFELSACDKGLLDEKLIDLA